MINRREIMVSGMAVTLLSRSATAAIPTADGVTRPTGRSVFIADLRNPAGRAAAGAAAALGASVRALEDDVTPIYQWLDLSLRTAPLTVAGLATANACFAIERLAWDRGLRTIYRGVHRPRDGRSMTHRLAGAPAIVERIGTMDSRAWAAQLGRAVAAARPGPGDLRHVVTAQWVPRSDEPGLVSWLLAPRAALHGTATANLIRA